jgi:uncharacterized protein YndB with AHSA1/START domain
MDARPSLGTGQDARTIVTTRMFDAPRELVFEAWTDPKHLVQWWGPNGFTTTIRAIDVRPGGVWRFVMHGPDGVDYENRIVYEEIVKPERLVYSHGGGGDVEPVQFQVTVTFEDHDGKTKLTMKALFPSAAERDRVAEKYGAVDGAKQTLERLAEHLAGLGGDLRATTKGEKTSRRSTQERAPPRTSQSARSLSPASSRRRVGSSLRHG